MIAKYNQKRQVLSVCPRFCITGLLLVETVGTIELGQSLYMCPVPARSVNVIWSGTLVMMTCGSVIESLKSFVTEKPFSCLRRCTDDLCSERLYSAVTVGLCSNRLVGDPFQRIAINFEYYTKYVSYYTQYRYTHQRDSHFRI